MANAAYNKKIEIDDGTGFTEIEGINDASISFNGDTLDTTTFKTATTNSGGRSKMYGLRDASVSLSGDFGGADASVRDELIDNWMGSGDTLELKYYPDGTDYFQFNVIVESFEPSGSVDGKEEISFSLASTGDISYTTV